MQEGEKRPRSYGRSVNKRTSAFRSGTAGTTVAFIVGRATLQRARRYTCRNSRRKPVFPRRSVCARTAVNLSRSLIFLNAFFFCFVPPLDRIVRSPKITRNDQRRGTHDRDVCPSPPNRPRGKEGSGGTSVVHTTVPGPATLNVSCFRGFRCDNNA